jgi:hypothetical protein
LIRSARLTAVSVAAVVLGVLALSVSAPPASAKTPCWRQIQNEWVAKDRVSTTYPLHCYREAIAHVPDDLAQYSSIIDDIVAARQQASRENVRRLSGRTPPTTNPNANDPDQPSRGVYKAALDKLGPNNADSFPLPLLILGGLSLLMVAAGGAGLLARHVRARKTAG